MKPLAKRTPGTWKNEGYLIIAPSKGVIAVVHDATTYTGHGSKVAEREANARLIAAAPELVEALQAMFNEFAYAGMEGEQEQACMLARRALAKAEGTI